MFLVGFFSSSENTAGGSNHGRTFVLMVAGAVEDEANEDAVITIVGGPGACYDLTSHQCTCNPNACTAELCAAANIIDDGTMMMWTADCPDHCDPEECLPSATSSSSTTTTTPPNTTVRDDEKVEHATSILPAAVMDVYDDDDEDEDDEDEDALVRQQSTPRFLSDKSVKGAKGKTRKSRKNDDDRNKNCSMTTFEGDYVFAKGCGGNSYHITIKEGRKGYVYEGKPLYDEDSGKILNMVRIIFISQTQTSHPLIHYIVIFNHLLLLF